MPPDAPSKSGIVTSANGQRSIPSSTRADGSQRKEIKIRPGYKPPEDAEVYRTRLAAARVTRGKGAGIPGVDIDGEKDGEKAGTAASNKNAKRREARKKAKEAGAVGEEGEGEGDERARDGQSEGMKESVNAADAVADEEVEKEKKAKKLRKKLREAKELQQKKERGEGLLPEQLQKALRMHELIRELTQLGISVDEEKNEGDQKQ